MPTPRPLNLASAVCPAAGLPQFTASSPSTTHPSPKRSDPPPPVKQPTRKPPSHPKPAQRVAPEGDRDLFSPPYWAKDGFSLYPDEVAATMAEFQNSVVCRKALGDGHFAGSVPSWARIHAFLKETELYDLKTRRWRDIPEDCEKVHQLFQPIRVLMDAITEHFGYVTTRPVMDSFHIPLNRLKFKEPRRKPDCRYRTTPLKKIPHMMALGVSGSNFGPLPSPFESGPSYAACISPVDLQTESKHDSTSDLIQLALYARQCFMRQHNRRFVYALMITESNATLYMFDRSGVCHSRPINIHQEATNFVQTILGVWSPDDAVVGFDTTISWDQDNRGEWRRYIDSVDEYCDPHRYPLVKSAPIYQRWFIEGRGTTCWVTRDDDGERLLIKDMWRDVSTRPEWEFLQAASGMEGVGRMVSAQDGARVSTLRRIPVESFPRHFVDRQFCRLVLKHYGSSNIARFKGRKDLLRGFRDAIAGHQRLWNAGILHGNVDMDNILLTSHYAPPGDRSVVIDLDLAMWFESGNDYSAVNFHNLGTRAYMSLNVLESHHNPRARFSRDHLDDLESFYYVLCHICATFTGPGEQLPKPDFIKAWEHPDTAYAASAKMGSLLYADFEPTPYFRAIFADLLEKLRGFFAKAAGRKRRDAMRRERTTGVRAPTWRDLQAAAREDYATVLRFVDDAIYEARFGRFMTVDDPDVEAAYRARVLALADGLPLPGALTGGFSQALGSGHGNSKKRAREEDVIQEEESPPPKRFKMYPPVVLEMLF